VTKLRVLGYETLFNAEDAEGFAEERKVGAFLCDLCGKLGDLCG
jgi:hypothetical protein